MKRRSFLALLGAVPAAIAIVPKIQAEDALDGEIIPPGEGAVTTRTMRSADGRSAIEFHDNGVAMNVAGVQLFI